VVILLASVAAISFAAASVNAKRGMQNTSPVTALMIMSAVASLILGSVVLFDQPETVTFRAVLLFVFAGFIGDGVGRFSMLSAVDRLGPSIAVPVQTAAYPLIAVVGGVVILSETVTISSIFGAVIVVAGIWVLMGPGSEVQTSQEAVAVTGRRWTLLALPALAGIGFASADLFRKSGLVEIPDPAFGALVGTVTMVLVLAVGAVSVPWVRRRMHVGPGWGWLVSAGVLIAIALLTLFKALEIGTVSRIGPIIAAQPLVIVVLSLVLLRNIERVTARMTAGALLVVAGVVLIAFGA
jgi:drug/metabolite transporter (DMT)-like permease|tara:strand:+ start:1094 stop:1981 length:888 start_codon:yes stop_codon:yes gene_type:complete